MAISTASRRVEPVHPLHPREPLELRLLETRRQEPEIDLTVTDDYVGELHYVLLQDIKSLLSDNVSEKVKWDIWCWIHDWPQSRIPWDSRGQQPKHGSKPPVVRSADTPLTFSQACALEGVDPVEMVLMIHETLERNGFTIKKPESVSRRMSFKRAQQLRRMGVTVHDPLALKLAPLAPADDSDDKPKQFELFAPVGEMEDVHV